MPALYPHRRHRPLRRRRLPDPVPPAQGHDHQRRFNIYPSDLEGVLRGHAAVADVAVVGVPSAAWGKTPVICVVTKPGSAASEAELREWWNARVGKTQRLAAVHLMAELPRSHIGKVLERELRERHMIDGG